MLAVDFYLLFGQLIDLKVNLDFTVLRVLISLLRGRNFFKLESIYLKAKGTERIVLPHLVDSLSPSPESTAPPHEPSFDATGDLLNGPERDDLSETERRTAEPPVDVFRLINEQRVDINRIMETVTSLQTELVLVKENMSKLEYNQTRIRDNSPEKASEATGHRIHVEESTAAVEKDVSHVERIAANDRDVESNKLISELRLETSRLKATLAKETFESISSVLPPATNSLPKQKARSPQARQSLRHAKAPNVTSLSGLQHVHLNAQGTTSSESSSDESLYSLSDKELDHGTRPNIEPHSNFQPKVKGVQQIQPPVPFLENLGPGELPVNARPIQFAQTTDQLSGSTDDFLKASRELRLTPPNEQKKKRGYETIVDSDPEDLNFRPGSHSAASPRTRGSDRIRGSRGGRKPGAGRPRRSLPVRLGTPEWEKPSWIQGEDPPTEDKETGVVTPINSRGRTIRRRGTGGGMSFAQTVHRPKYSGGESWDGRQRDAEGYLLKANGERDGRSMKHKQEKDMGPSAQPFNEASVLSPHEKLMRQIFPARKTSVSRSTVEKGGLSS